MNAKPGRRLRSLVDLGLLAMLAAASGASAQSIPYEVRTEPALYVPLPTIATQTVQPTSYSLGYADWDEGAASVPIAFDFPWFARRYRTIWVYTNGFFSFQAPPTGQAVNILGAPSSVPNPSTVPHATIAPLWQDLVGTPTAEIRYLAEGAAPNRRLIIQVSGLRRSNTPTSEVEYQLRLEESGLARITYGPRNSGVVGASVSVEDHVGVLGGGLLTANVACAATCACGSRGCGSTNLQLPSGGDLSIVIEPPATAELIGAIEAPASAAPGTSFTATITVTNVGLAAAGESRVSVRLSLDPTVDASDQVIGSVASPALAGGASVTRAVALTMPANVGVGRVYVGAIVDADAQITESNEANNVARDPRGVATGPDFSVTVATTLSSGPGEDLDVVLGLRSRDAPFRAPVPVELFLSRDATLDAGDRSLGSRSFTLPDGLVLDTIWRLTLPGDLAAGAYRLIASVDPANVTAEVDETNNVAVSPGTLTLTLSDLQVTAITSAPVAFRGLPFPVEARVENRGGGGARGVEACLVLSRNPLVSVTTDPVIARSTPLTVLGGEVATLRFEPVLDTRTGTGTWNLALVADCDDRVTESSEVNNTRRRDPPIRVLDPAPDLAALEVRTASTGAAGEVLSATVLVGNYGVVDGAANVRFVLTSASVATPSDRTLADVPMPRTLAPGRETTFAAQLPIPGELASGRYVVGAVVDPLAQVAEVDETNNVASARAVQIVGTGVAVVSPSPPNAIVDVGYAWRFQAVGGTRPYTWSAAWGASGAPAGLAFDAARGELAGTPTAVGSHTLTITVRAAAELATATYTLLVTPPTLPLGIVSSKLPPALERESYGARLVAVGGAPPYRWSLVSARNTLPAGLGVVESGEVAGQAVGPGAYAFRVRVVDASGNEDEADLAIDVVDPRVTLSITTTDVPSGQVGETYERIFEVTGGTEPYRWRFDGVPIPGLRFDAEAAKLVGTPTVAGSYGFVVEARDARGLLDRNAYVLRVFEVGELSIVTGRAEDARLPVATLNAPYLTPDGQPVRLRAALRSAAASGVSWLVVLGGLPPGLALDGATGTISGVPTTAGVFAFNVLATTPNGDRDRVTLAITVDDPSATPPVADTGCGCGVAGARSSGVSLWALVLAWPLVRRRRRGAGRSANVAKFALGLWTVLIAAVPARAQTVEYQVTTTRAPYVELVDGQAFTLPFGVEAGLLELPFEVYLFDTPTRRLELTAAGVVGLEGTFGSTSFVGGPPQNAPSAAAPNGFIAALWGDWCSPTSFSCFVSPARPDAGLYTRIEAPDPAVGGRRSVTIEWRALPSGNDFDVPSAVYAQLRAFEGFPPRVELTYGPTVQGSSFGFPSALSARIGVESADGRSGAWLAPCGGSSPCDAGAVVALAGTRITLEGRGVRDLAVTEVDAPTQAFEGRSFSVDVTVVSADEVELGPVDLELYAHNLASTSTDTAVRIGSLQGLRFAPFERKRVSFAPEVRAGQAPGRYALLAVIDSGRAVTERDERNNLGRSGPVQYFEAKPDVWVDAVRVTSPSGTARPRAGGQIQLEYTLGNRGSPAATVELACVGSRNASLTSSDRRLVTVSRALAGGEQRVERVVCQLPEALDPGPYLFGVIVDPDARVEELLETNNVAAIAAPIPVAGGPLLLLTDSLPVATLTRPYAARIEVAGGFDVATARLVSGALPRGLELDGTRREIRGVPLQVGRFPLQIEVDDDGLAQVRGSVVLEVLDPRGPLTMVTHALPDGLVGEPYQVVIHVAGGTPPLSWRLDGALPDGLALSTAGVLFGTPRAAGPSRFAVTVVDATTRTATAALSLDVRTPGNLTIVARALPAAYVDADYAETLLALGGRPPYGWAVVSGAVPGLTLAENGALVGRPSEVGTFDLVVRVFDAEGAVDTAAFPVTVESRRRMAIVADGFGRATIDVPFRGRLRVEGGRRPHEWSVAVGEGALPGGLRAVAGDPTIAGESSNDFVIAGVPTQLGTWPVTIRVRDAQGTVASLPVAIMVDPAPVVAEPPSGCATAPDAPALVAVALASLFLARSRRRRRATA